MDSQASQPNKPQIDVATVAQDFQQAMAGKLGDEQTSAAVQAINATSAAAANTAYAANGSVMSMIFYLQFQVTVNGGKTFNGKGGGISSPGGGALFGTVYTDDINKLYSDTKSFQFTATSVYVSLVFFDGHSNVLGTFQAGGVSTVNGVGGGSGSWS